ncbi:MAG: hypothetical protein KBA53_01760 [Thermoclostridium sp.]|nr:hypothetical protein [Thermoclostridium sp.]
MAKKVLIYIEDRVIKGIVLKILHDNGLEFLEGLDINDIQLKLDIFQDTIFFQIIQIGRETSKEQYEFVRKMKEESATDFPVLAIIPDDVSEFVGGAKKAGIEDVVLIPEKREQMRDIFYTRITEFVKTLPHEEPIHEHELQKAYGTADLTTDEAIKREINRAVRGKYSISFVMGRFTGINVGSIHEFYDKLKKDMRDTDRIISYDYHTVIVVCPFTVKSYLIEVEKKIREAFEGMFGYSRVRRLDMYGVTYPDDGTNIIELTGILEKGVHDSIIISSIREPLNSISRERLEEYRKMLKLYK